MQHNADISKVTVDGETAIDVAEGEEMEDLLRAEVEKRGQLVVHVGIDNQL